MVDTIKFSQMTAGGDLGNDSKTPGLLNGENVLFNNPWTFLPPGTTAERPTPSAAINYRLRFNTDDQLYEYYDAFLGAWTQLQENTFTSGPFVIYKADAAFPDAQDIGLLTTGIVKQTVVAGINTLSTAVNGTDYYGPGFTGYLQSPAGINDINALKVVEFRTVGVTATDWLVLQNGLTGAPSTLTVDGPATDIQLNLYGKNLGPVTFGTTEFTNAFIFVSGTGYQHQTRFSFADTAINVNVRWQDVSGTVAYLNDIANTVTSATGTLNQVYINGTAGVPQTGAIGFTLPQDIDTTSSPTFANPIFGAPLLGTPTSGVLTNCTGLPLTTGVVGNLPVTNLDSGTNASNVTYWRGDGTWDTPAGTGTNTVQGTQFQVLVDGSFGVPTSGDVTLTTPQDIAPTSSVTFASLTLTTPLTGANGGTGVNNGSSTITLGGSLSTIGAFTAAFTMTANTAVTFPVSGTLATTSQIPFFGWLPTAGTTQAVAVGQGYVAQNAAQTTFTLPLTAPFGSMVAVQGLGAAGWKIQANTGQTIKGGSLVTSTAGSITSQGADDNAFLLCVVANTTWQVTSTYSQGLTYA